MAIPGRVMPLRRADRPPGRRTRTPWRPIPDSEEPDVAKERAADLAGAWDELGLRAGVVDPSD
jgi:hypothetical protein